MKQYPTILLADDDEDDRILFIDALKEIDPAIQCIMAKNGLDALTILQNDLIQAPDYVFLDLNMPVMNGLKCLAEIKKIESSSKIPIIIYSTSSNNKFIEESKVHGAFDFFIKPTDYSGLLKYLQKLF